MHSGNATTMDCERQDNSNFGIPFDDDHHDDFIHISGNIDEENRECDGNNRGDTGIILSTSCSGPSPTTAGSDDEQNVASFVNVNNVVEDAENEGKNQGNAAATDAAAAATTSGTDITSKQTGSVHPNNTPRDTMPADASINRNDTTASNNINDCSAAMSGMVIEFNSDDERENEPSLSSSVCGGTIISSVGSTTVDKQNQLTETYYNSLLPPMQINNTNEVGESSIFETVDSENLTLPASEVPASVLEDDLPSIVGRNVNNENMVPNKDRAASIRDDDGSKDEGEMAQDPSINNKEKDDVTKMIDILESSELLQVVVPAVRLLALVVTLILSSSSDDAWKIMDSNIQSSPYIEKDLKDTVTKLALEKKWTELKTLLECSSDVPSTSRNMSILESVRKVVRAIISSSSKLHRDSEKKHKYLEDVRHASSYEAIIKTLLLSCEAFKLSARVLIAKDIENKRFDLLLLPDRFHCEQVQRQTPLDDCGSEVRSVASAATSSSRETNDSNNLPKYKIIMLGDSEVGKSCLLTRLRDPDKPFNQFNTISTIGIDYDSQILNTDHGPVKAQIWDTAGQERYAKVMLPAYFRNTKGVIFVYDRTNPSSLESIEQHWMCELDKYCATENNSSSDFVVRLLVGTKSDLTNKIAVSQEMVEDFCRRFNMTMVNTSSKNGHNVQLAFEKLVGIVHDFDLATRIQTPLISNTSTTTTKYVYPYSNITTTSGSRSGKNPPSRAFRLGTHSNASSAGTRKKCCS